MLVLIGFLFRGKFYFHLNATTIYPNLLCRFLTAWNIGLR